MRDAPLSLLKSKSKALGLAPHLKTRPVELHKFKSAVFLRPAAAPPQHFSPAPTQFICAVKIENMSKTCRAYHEVEALPRCIKPDHQLKVPPAPEFKELPRPETPRHDPEPEVMPADEDGRFCICNQPYFRGDLMFKCEGYCGNWYHPKCLGMHYTEIDKHSKTSERWYCNECYEHAYSLYVACSPRKPDNKKKTK